MQRTRYIVDVCLRLFVTERVSYCLNHRYSTLFVRIAPDVNSLQLCAIEVVGV
jgi:hypothetical protein